MTCIGRSRHADVQTPFCPQCGEAVHKPVIRIDSLQQLREVYADLGVRPDWHEPDEQEVTAKFDGYCFDNAGFWPDCEQSTDLRDAKATEMCIILYKGERVVAMVNLATLFALACRTHS